MKLSIIIPVYNVSNWLPTTIDSVLSQTFAEFELILVDDGSTDGSGTICDSYAAKDSRIRVVHLTNGGVSIARNTGVAMACGEYIGFTDSDDIIEADMYEILIRLAEKYNADVVQCQHDRAQSLNGNARAADAIIMDGSAFVRRIFTKKSADYTNQVSLCTKIIRRSFFEKDTFPAGQVYEDEQETYKLCLKAKVLAETSDILYHYVCRENSIITGVSGKKMLDKQKALLDRLGYLPTVLPDMKENCARTFLLYSERILCQLRGEDFKKARKVLMDAKPLYVGYMNKYERLYFPMLFVPGMCGWVQKNEFEPIQKMLLRLRRK